MTTLNEIPEYLKERAAPEWTPCRGLIRGTMATGLACAALGSMLCTVAYFAPYVTNHALLNLAWGFIIAWLLFAAMHHAAGMVGPACTFIVLCFAMLLLVCKHLAVLMRVTPGAGGLATAWASFHPGEMIGANVAAWVGILAATLACKNGGLSLWDLLKLPRCSRWWV